MRRNPDGAVMRTVASSFFAPNGAFSIWRIMSTLRYSTAKNGIIDLQFSGFRVVLLIPQIKEESIMTEQQKMKITSLREAGLGYKKISKLMVLPESTVKSYCRRNGLTGKRDVGMQIGICFCCGKPVQQNPGRKEKKFCSDKCRNKWWSGRLDGVNRKAFYEFECQGCKRKFTAYGNSKRKYCSHDCYIKDRFGEKENGVLREYTNNQII